MVSQWANIPIYEAEKLDILQYLQYRRDAFISRMNGTEAGRKYLDKAWMLEQTEPDRQTLRDRFGKR